MNDFERRIRQLIDPYKTKLTNWWSAFMSRTGNSAEMRREATERAHKAASDLRDSDAAKRAATALKDLRDSDAAKRAASALSDLRQHDSVRKAEESAKRALHDLRSGHGNGGSSAS